jgi:hypothetical protein
MLFMAEGLEMPVPYEAPPRPRTVAGEVRRVGLELEFAHVAVDEAAEIVARTFGGRVTNESAAKSKVEGTPLGTFQVELDSTPVRERRYLEPLEKLGLDSEGPTADALEGAVVRLAREIFPVEIVTPPIPWTELGALDPLWAALRAAGARDTRASFFYAFGLHMNPELPDLEASTVVECLRSFFLLEDWIRARADIDISRRAAPYVDPFPETYRRRVIDPSYAPDWAAFVSDYVPSNPTRNRSLDLLPLIAHAWPADLGDQIENWSKVKPRPAFHYRLPNSELNQPAWTPAVDWNRWVAVERVADDRALLDELAREYLRRWETASTSEPLAWTEFVANHLRAIDVDDRASAR